MPNYSFYPKAQPNRRNVTGAFLFLVVGGGMGVNGRLLTGETANIEKKIS